jgi:hypothetical protein
MSGGPPIFVLTPDRQTVWAEKELTVAFEGQRDRGQSRCFRLHGDDGEYLSAIGEGFGPTHLGRSDRLEGDRSTLRSIRPKRARRPSDASVDPTEAA